MLCATPLPRPLAPCLHVAASALAQVSLRDRHFRSSHQVCRRRHDGVRHARYVLGDSRCRRFPIFPFPFCILLNVILYVSPQPRTERQNGTSRYLACDPSGSTPWSARRETYDLAPSSCSPPRLRLRDPPISLSSSSSFRRGEVSDFDYVGVLLDSLTTVDYCAGHSRSARSSEPPRASGSNLLRRLYMTRFRYACTCSGPISTASSAQ